MTTMTFLIPVRHYANARDWSLLKSNLRQTVASISAQTHGDWRGLIIANEGSDLPPLPERFGVEWVHFPPNDMHELKASATREQFYDAFRIDKGRRVLSGMLRARDSRFFMIVDDDDFVSSRITQHAVDHPHANGWTVNHGYIWSDRGQWLLEHDEFNTICGTSLIVRSDLYALPERFEDASPDYIKSMLGSHVQLHHILEERNTPLQALPFRGAVYRVGQAGSHSQAPGILRKYFLNRQALRKPSQLMRDARRLRILNRELRQQFFGAVPGPQSA